MSNEIVKTQDSELMEQVLLGGDLSKLSPSQRLNYYQRVCESMGLNPLTKPFDYIQLNNKLTLYAKKDAADQLRRIHSVSIDDVEMTETDKQYLVKVKGHDKTGRADVEVAVVDKSDMRGNLANAQMKAVTKGKRRLTLSICGLGWLDETEIETIPDARPVVVAETGEIVDTSPENISQENGEPTPPRELIDPMGEWAVKYAMAKWNIGQPEACKAIASKRLGKRIEKADFIAIVDGAGA